MVILRLIGGHVEPDHDTEGELGTLSVWESVAGGTVVVVVSVVRAVSAVPVRVLTFTDKLSLAV